jgi:hypothetical protein
MNMPYILTYSAHHKNFQIEGMPPASIKSEYRCKKIQTKTLELKGWNIPLLNIATLGSDMPEPGKTLEVSQAAMSAKVKRFQ